VVLALVVIQNAYDNSTNSNFSLALDLQQQQPVGTIASSSSLSMTDAIILLVFSIWCMAVVWISRSFYLSINLSIYRDLSIYLSIYLSIVIYRDLS